MCAKYLITQTFPIDKGKEFGEIYLKIYESFPSYINLIGASPYITTTEQDIKIYTVIEIPNNLTGKGLSDIHEFFNKYNSVIGHSWKIESLMRRRDAIRLVGLSFNKNKKD